MEEDAQPSELVDSLARAREEWNLAQSLFDSVTDPDMVDAAIHLIAAAERKYSYLLRLARNQGLQLPPPGVAGDGRG